MSTLAGTSAVSSPTILLLALDFLFEFPILSLSDFSVLASWQLALSLLPDDMERVFRCFFRPEFELVDKWELVRRRLALRKLQRVGVVAGEGITTERIKCNFIIIILLAIFERH